MRRLLLGTALVAAGGMSALAASAQDMFSAGDDASLIRATEFIGQPIYSTETAVTGAGIVGVQDDWKTIGDISDVLLTRDGRIEAVVVDVGGFLDLGAREIAIRPATLYFVENRATGGNTGDYLIVMTAGRSVFESAPIYQRGIGAAGTSGTTAGSGVTAMTDNGAGDSVGAAPNATASDEGRAAGVAALANAEGSAQGGISDRETAAANAEGDGASTGDAPAAGMDGFLRADMTGVDPKDLDGLRVFAPDGAELGRIAGLVEGGAGGTTLVVLQVAAAEGMAEKSVAVDLQAVEVMRADGGSELRAVLQMTPEELQVLPTLQ